MNTAQTLRIEKIQDFFEHENKFSILASDEDAQFIRDSEVAEHLTGTECETWWSGEERHDEFSCRGGQVMNAGALRSR